MAEKLVIGKHRFIRRKEMEETKEEIEKICCIRFEDGKAVEIGCEDEHNSSILNNIYIAKVSQVVSNIQAAFLELENGEKGYLSLKENTSFIYRNRTSKKSLAAGDEILVQVAKEPMKNKSATLTSKLSISGRFAVLLTDTDRIMFSSKLSLKEKNKLRERVGKEEFHYGFVIRTNAKEVKMETIIGEMKQLSEKMDRIIKIAPHRTCFSCLYHQENHFLSMIKNSYQEKLSEIVTDDMEIYKEIKQYLNEEQPDNVWKLQFYDASRVPLSCTYEFKRIFDEALSKKVWLKSGAYLVIEPTEALLVIDVNSGKNVSKKKDLQETFFKTNIEAAIEIARQLRLRNISGICIVDFVNLKKEEDTKELMDVLRKELKKDPVPTSLEGITGLFLVEITRKKMHRPLWEQIYG